MTNAEYTDLAVRICHLSSQLAVEGMRKLLAEAALVKPFINQAEAYRIYGRKNVQAWVRAGRVRKIKNTRAMYYIHELNAASAQGELDETIAKLQSLSNYYDNGRQNQIAPRCAE